MAMTASRPATAMIDRGNEVVTPDDGRIDQDRGTA
jgi:hypothetical protein